MDNIFINKDGILKLADFGMCVKLAEGKFDRTMCGTPQYMAPETIKREYKSFPSDIFSVGVIVIMMINLQYPFKNEHEILKKVVKINQEA